MTTALLEEKVEFVNLFVMNGLVMEDYLTVGTLRFLYNQAVSLALALAVNASMHCDNNTSSGDDKSPW